MERSEALFNDLTLFGPTEFRIGMLLNDSIPSTLDEVAVWRRALEDAEIEAVYNRAALRLGFQVRACSQPDCRDDPAFVGPDGDPAAQFIDPGSAPIDLAVAPPLVGRYVQYRAALDATIAGSGAAGPQLLAVTVSGQLP